MKAPRLALIAAILIIVASRAEDLASALAGGRYSQALQTADELLAADSGNPRLWTLRGIALRGLERLPESLSSFERALSISSRMLPALEGAAEAAYLLHNQRASEYVNRILRLDPSNEMAHAMAGALAVEAHRCGDAIGHFDQSGAALDRNGPALLQFGACLLQEKAAARAIPVFTKLLALNPPDTVANAEALNLLAAAYEKTGQVRNAIAALRKASELAPRDENNYVDLAVLCMDHQAGPVAIEVLDVGLHNIPDSARLHAVKGAVLAQLGKTEDAEAEFNLADRLHPDQVYGSLGLGTLYQEVRRTGDAVALLRGKLAVAPEDYRLNFLLADTLLRDGGNDDAAVAEARAALQQVIRSQPDYAKAHSILGKLYAKNGELDKAIDELRIAVKLDPNDRTGLNQLQLALRRKGLRQEADRVAAALRATIETDRNDEGVRNQVRVK